MHDLGHRFGNLQAGAERDRVTSQRHRTAGEQHKGTTRHVRGHRYARREPGTFLRASLHHAQCFHAVLGHAYFLFIV